MPEPEPELEPELELQSVSAPDADCHAFCLPPQLLPLPPLLSLLQRFAAALGTLHYAPEIMQATLIPGNRQQANARHEILALGFPSLFLSLCLSLSFPHAVTHLSATCFMHKWRDFVAATFACSLQVEPKRGGQGRRTCRRGTHLTPHGRGTLNFSMK